MTDSIQQVWKRFQSFPYSRSTWVLAIDQLEKSSSSNRAVFIDEINGSPERIEEIKSTFDFTKVTNMIIGLGVNEFLNAGDQTEYVQKTLINCQKRFPNLENIYIFYTTTSFVSSELVANCKITSIHIPYFLLRSTLTDISKFQKWSVGDKKAMCLIGDIRQRPHKFPLLYYFYNMGKLDIFNYTLTDENFPNYVFSHDNMGIVVAYINQLFDANLDMKSFEQLYKQLRRTLPNDDEYLSRKWPGLSTCTYAYPKQWNDSCLNVVLESAFMQNHKYTDTIVPGQEKNEPERFFFSEKIWKPILSCKPFVTISENDIIYKQLETLGFRTFLKYTSRPNLLTYTSSNDSGYDANYNGKLKRYLEVCYIRINSFLKNVEANKNSILEDAIFNVERWKELSQQAWDDVHYNCPPTKTMTNAEFCEIFNHCQDFELFNSQWHNKE